jgi:hypothetical protein
MINEVASQFRKHGNPTWKSTSDFSEIHTFQEAIPSLTRTVCLDGYMQGWPGLGQTLQVQCHISGAPAAFELPAPPGCPSTPALGFRCFSGPQS